MRYHSLIVERVDAARLAARSSRRAERRPTEIHALRHSDAPGVGRAVPPRVRPDAGRQAAAAQLPRAGRAVRRRRARRPRWLPSVLGAQDVVLRDAGPGHASPPSCATPHRAAARAARRDRRRLVLAARHASSRRASSSSAGRRTSRAGCRATSSSSAATCSCGPASDITGRAVAIGGTRVRAPSSAASAARSRAIATTHYAIVADGRSRYELDVPGPRAGSAAACSSSRVCRGCCCRRTTAWTDCRSPSARSSRSANRVGRARSPSVDLSQPARRRGSRRRDPRRRRTARCASRRTSARSTRTNDGWIYSRSPQLGRDARLRQRLAQLLPRRRRHGAPRSGTSRRPTFELEPFVGGRYEKVSPITAVGNVYSFTGRNVHRAHRASQSARRARRRSAPALAGARARRIASGRCSARLARRGRAEPRDARQARRRSRSSRWTDRSSSRHSARSDCASTRTGSTTAGDSDPRSRYAYLGRAARCRCWSCSSRAATSCCSSRAGTRSRSRRSCCRCSARRRCTCDIAWVRPACGSLPKLEQEIGAGCGSACCASTSRSTPPASATRVQLRRLASRSDAGSVRRGARLALLARRRRILTGVKVASGARSACASHRRGPASRS